ncbi:SdpI family protein [Roseivirga sp. E12]|uniref:SdpI family protein n=1 Tax=Roseivirga sp. E12 TaxID=2819237 RepID=UPI001ABC2DDF|nr:SdpI family protein [Roseivirga sp. E12]MBO3698437.1 SdpI family protein [Roseivirga sp. E12]
MSNSELIMVHSILAFSSILIGTLGKLVRPEKPNGMMGYRTKRSMKSQEAWDFSNEYAGNLMMWTSIVTITLQIFAYFVLDAMISIYVVLGAVTLSMFVVMGLTEYQLAQRFDREGKPKSISQIKDRF